MILDVAKLRKDFPCLQQNVYGKPLVYFDNASTGQKPKCVIDEVANYYEHFTSNIHRGAYFISEIATKKFSDARKFIAQFLGVSDEQQIVFTRSTTESINLVAHGLKKVHFQEGDEIILTQMEHHANIVPWYLLAKELNLTLHVANVLDDGTLDLEAFKALFNQKTKLAAFAHASNALGSINPIQEMVAIAQSFGVATLIDGAQGAHHLSLNLDALGADFYCFSGHKSYGPSGIGVLYAKKPWLDRFPPYQGGGDMIESVSFDKITFACPPRKFEAGTPNIEGALGLKQALLYLSQVGLPAIHDYEKSLHDRAFLQLAQFKQIKIIGTAKNKVGLLSFIIDGVHPHDVSSIFDREGIAIRAGHLCAQPLMKRFGVQALCRASFAFYNTYEEVDYFVNALKRVFEVFKL